MSAAAQVSKLELNMLRVLGRARPLEGKSDGKSIVLFACTATTYGYMDSLITSFEQSRDPKFCGVVALYCKRTAYSARYRAGEIGPRGGRGV
jgi:hypothetical protein